MATTLILSIVGILGSCLFMFLYLVVKVVKSDIAYRNRLLKEIDLIERDYIEDFKGSELTATAWFGKFRAIIKRVKPRSNEL